MPSPDFRKLSIEGLLMPSVDHLSNKAILNVLLDRALTGGPAGLTPAWSAVGLFMNFTRLTDKALREYDAARSEILTYLEPHPGLRTSPYIRAVDHLENCLSAVHRAALNAKALRSMKVGRAGPHLTPRQEERLGFARNAVEHSDEKLLGKQKFKSSPPFTPGQSYSLRAGNAGIVIGQQTLTYTELAVAMTKMSKLIETIRKAPTGTPSPSFLNAKLRTDSVAATSKGSLQPTTYLEELSRLMVTH